MCVRSSIVILYKYTVISDLEKKNCILVITQKNLFLTSEVKNLLVECTKDNIICAAGVCIDAYASIGSMHI